MISSINESEKYFAFLLTFLLLLTACAQVPRVNRHGLPQREYVYQETVKIAYRDESENIQESTVKRESRGRAVTLSPTMPPAFIEFESKMLDV